MLNIRYGMKFMAKHVVFMGTADTTNDGMHFILETVWVAYKGRREGYVMTPAMAMKRVRGKNTPSILLCYTLRFQASIYFYSR